MSVRPEKYVFSIENGINEFSCEHPDHDQPMQWCQHLRGVVLRGEDAKMLHPDMKILVPVFPAHDIFVPVYITAEVIAGFASPMEMEFQPDLGAMKRIPLGLWNKGEGLRSIRSVIQDHLKSKLDPEEDWKAGPIKSRCPSGSHGLQASRLMQERARRDKEWKWACLWNIAMEKACTPCIEESGNVRQNNFGIDPDSVKKPAPPWSPYANA